MKAKPGILLVNLGTPNSPTPKDVRQYLTEFLTDERVIDLPWLKRQTLVRGVIVPNRYQKSSKAYKSIWSEEGSPLMVHGKRVASALKERLDGRAAIELAMRYQSPSIEKGLASLQQKGVDHLLIFPLFPQYASATTGSVHCKVMDCLKTWNVIPKTTFISNYATHPALIEAFCTIVANYPLETYDHILFSFHSLPERHLLKANPRGICLKNKDCCATLCDENRSCYSAQCYATAQAIQKELRIPDSKSTICFQSKMGKEPWLQPGTQQTIKQLAQSGEKRILIICPSFVCDCIETLEEIGIRYAEDFRALGGEQLDLVDGLNDHPKWIRALDAMISEQL